MAKVTSYQRMERAGSPYTIHTPVDTEFGTRVTQLTGVWFETTEGWDEATGAEMTEVKRHQEDLGTHSTPLLASVASETWRATKVVEVDPASDA